MKHGPLALIEEGVPIVILAPSDSLFEKTASNVQEMIARGGNVILLSDRKGIEKLSAHRHTRMRWWKWHMSTP